MPGTDWHLWHAGYDDPDSDLSRRRRSVQRRVEEFLDTRDDDSLQVVSACAGTGEDLLTLLARRPEDADRVSARLLELDDGLADAAASYARAHGLTGVEVRRDDAGRTDSYAGAVPADLVMMCGVFGNVTDDDIRTTIEVLPGLCARGATVVWTRGRFRSGDLAPEIRGWFADVGFEELAMDVPDDTTYRVGAHRLVRAPDPLTPGVLFFSFVR